MKENKENKSKAHVVNYHLKNADLNKEKRKRQGNLRRRIKLKFREER